MEHPAIDRAFRELFPTRSSEPLRTADKLQAILTDSNGAVKKETLLDALCEGLEFQFASNVSTWDLHRTLDHIDAIADMPIDWDDIPTVRFLLHKGKTVPEIVATLRHMAA